MLVDTFSGWVEAFPARAEMAALPSSRLPGSLQNDNDLALVSQVKKRDNKCPRHKMDLALFKDWILQSLNKVGRSNQTLLRLWQETQENWIRLLPIALLNMWLAPKHKLKLSAFELLYGRPIIPQAQEKGHLRQLEMEQLKYTLQTGETMKPLTEYVTSAAALPGQRRGKPKNLENQQLAWSAHS